jgi:iron complex outermembrane receptor protein
MFSQFLRGGRSLLLVAAVLPPQLAAQPDKDLTQISLEDLLNIKVTSVSRKEQRLSKAGAAVFVISREDIRRSGMTRIPELLRMVPGVNVARVSTNTWALSIRGFNDRYASKVLVLIDGRSVYSQQFSGVFWDQQMVPVEEIERIEVIRGPGGTVWGANAVNGVISIITRKSRDTQGGLLSAGTGSQESVQGYVRYGGSLGKNATYRLYSSYFNYDAANSATGVAASDAWHATQGGFRMDWNITDRDSVTVQADAFRGVEGQVSTVVSQFDNYRKITLFSRVETATTNLTGVWKHAFANGADTSLQVFYNDAPRVETFDNDQDTYDVDFQYHFKLGSRHDLVTGLQARRATLDTEGVYDVQFTSPQLKSSLVTGFVQDEFQLTQHVSLIAGTKLERNSFTGFEYEPSAQVVWAPHDGETLWASVGRAIRQPTWIYENSILNIGTTTLQDGGLGVIRIVGNPNSQVERLVNFQGGYRRQFTPRVTVDLAGFRSYYYGVVTTESMTPFFEPQPNPPHLVIPIMWDSRARARSYGGGLSAALQVTSRWRLSPALSYLQMKVRREPGSTDTLAEGTARNSPKFQGSIRSTVDLPHRFEWDAAAFYVGPIQPALTFGARPSIDHYVRVDTRIGWKFRESMEFSIAGQNLLAPRHAEFPDAQHLHATPVQRAIVTKAVWHF